MDLPAALELARVIHAEGRGRLLAVGRFIPFGDDNPAAPWGCSLIIDGQEKPFTVWSLSDYRLALPTLAPPDVSAPAAAPRPDAKHRRQMSLF